MSNVLQDASDDLRERRGVDLETARRMAADAYARRNKTGDARHLDHQPDYVARQNELQRGGDR
jgi:hypothetical protein